VLRERLRERLQRSHGDGGEERVPVGEVPVRGPHRDAEAAAQLGEREAPYPALGDQLHGAVDERGLQIAVVVRLRALLRHGSQAAGTWSRHECRGSYPIDCLARSLERSDSNSPSSRRSWTPGKTSATSAVDERFMTVSAAAMTKLGLPATTSSGASS